MHGISANAGTLRRVIRPRDHAQNPIFPTLFITHRIIHAFSNVAILAALAMEYAFTRDITRIGSNIGSIINRKQHTKSHVFARNRAIEKKRNNGYALIKIAVTSGLRFRLY